MTVRSGMIFALAASLALGGCAAGAAGGGGPLTSPTGRVYEPGTEPTQTAESRAATLAIATGNFEQALQDARAGIGLDATNPVHFYLAGEAAAGLEQYELADSMWSVAQQIYPAYEIEIEPAREQVWADAFNLGVEAYNANNVDEALRYWRGAHLIFPLRPEAAQNLGILLQQENEYEEAIEVFRQSLANLDIEPATRVIEEQEAADREEVRIFMEEQLAQLYLFTQQFAEAEALLREMLAEDPNNVDVKINLAQALAEQGDDQEAAQIYSELLTAPDLSYMQLFNVGVSLFNAEEYVRAAEAFARLTQSVPNSRDAWTNRANALYSAEAWGDLVPIAEQLAGIDPLSDNTALILARAFREEGMNDRALAELQRIEDLPVFMESVQMQPQGERTLIRGRLAANAAAAGTPIRLRFTFYNANGQQVGQQAVTVNAPAAEQTQDFEVQVEAEADAYSYELVQ